MSMGNSQIPEGFATIRTRGLSRSKSRIDQSSRKNPLKATGSGPLYENNNKLYYKSISSSLISVAPPTAPVIVQNNIQLEEEDEETTDLKINKEDQVDFNQIDEDVFYSSSLTYETFKPLKSANNLYNNDSPDYLSITQSTEYIESLPYDFMLPPLKSPQYINELNLIKSKHDSSRIEQTPLYARPDSPRYGKIRDSYRSTTPESLDNGSSNSSTYSHPTQRPKTHSLSSYTIQDTEIIATKPPIYANNNNNNNGKINYRKSFNHTSSRIIYEDPKIVRNGNTSSDADSFDGSTYMKIHNDMCSEMFNNHQQHQASENGFHLKRYATMGHQPRDVHRITKSSINLPYDTRSTTSLNDNDFDKMNPLDYKVGCQTILRSRPLIPWYELAIKKENRQSCPPLKAHVVSAFEQSLGNMTTRLQTLTATTEKKDSEILEMRQTIELLRKHSIQAGLTTAHMQSMGVQVNGQVNGKNNLDNCAPLSLPPSNTRMQRHHSSDSMCSLNSMSSGCSAQEKKKKKGWLRNSFSKAFSRNAKISKTSRHVSQASNLDSSSNQSHTDIPNHHHQSRPLPPSPTKSPHKTMTVIENAKPIDAIELTDNIIVEDLKKQLREKDLVLTDIRLEALNSASQLENLKDTVMKMRQEMMNLKQNNERLQRLVTTRSLAGSEISLGGTVSPNGSTGDNRRYSLAADNGMSRAPLELPQNLDEAEEDNIPPAPAPEPPPEPLSPTIIAGLSPTIDKVFVNELLSVPAEEVGDPIDGKKISIAVYLGQPESFNRYAEEMNECDNFYISSPEDESKPMENDCGKRSFSSNNHSNEFTIAYTYISGKTTWQNLDYIVRKTFKDYVGRIDPGTNLGLNTDSITSYHLGEAKRGPELGFPELLPCGYIIGNVKTLYICLQGVGSLAFDSLILRNIVHRYITLLTEHRRLILCGPSGTGKSYLARKLAEFLVARSGRENPADAIATFNVDHKSSKELQQYLGHIAEQASMLNGAAELPSVIILDNLHHASALGDVFSCLLSATASKLPCIIGTMSQATCNTTNLQLHHNFRWVLTANHMEPVKGFLARYLRRKLFTLELTTTTQQPQLEKVLKWLPTVWQHINSFLETHNSSDVTIGPRLFLSCPLDMKDSQVWFTDIWNYHLAPYIMDTIREGVQLYGRRGGSWVDPCTYVRESYPWPVSPTTVPTLRQITAEDVGLEASTTGNSENQDPLLNMLMRLQEAANYNGSQEPDSDCVSLASDITHDSSVAE